MTERGPLEAVTPDLASIASSQEAPIKVGDVVQQVGKYRRGGLRVTRISPGGHAAMCVRIHWNGTMHRIGVDVLKRVT